VALARTEFDAEYVRRLVAADPETEAHFARYFGEMLTIKLRARLRTASEVHDAKQETFARVLRSLKQGALKAPETLGAFVNSVCNNVLLETYRTKARTSPLDDDYERADTAPGSDVSVIAAEERERVRLVLAGLPPRERQLLTWLFFDERDKDAICRDMRIDRNYLRVLVHRAKKLFRERLGALTPTGPV
jgi:RNA polymerase sigma-70 factor (ECF subfamily)